MAGAALALGLALTGCGQQTLVGEGALDPEAPQVSAEEARQEAARLQEEGVGHGSEGGEGGGHGSEGGESHSESGSAAGGAKDHGTGSGGGAEDHGSGSGGGAEGAAGGITDEALAQFEQQFPAISAVASEQQLRTTATQVCSAMAAGGTAAGQQVVETLPGVTGTTAQQVVGFFDREVCPH